MLWQALLINAVVLTVVLESDLGRHRKITRFRIFRPLVTSLLIVPFFIKGAAASGVGLALELGLTAVGVLTALLAMSLMTVYMSRETGKPATRAGLSYALVWTVAIAARTAFSYGSEHWFAAPLGTWMAQQHVTSDTLVDSLIFMAVAMVLTRVASMGIRGRAIRRQPTPTPASAMPGPGSTSRSATSSTVGHAAAETAGLLTNLLVARQDERATRRAGRRPR
jgi:hypothetical protein